MGNSIYYGTQVLVNNSGEFVAQLGDNVEVVNEYGGTIIGIVETIDTANDYIAVSGIKLYMRSIASIRRLENNLQKLFTNLKV